MLTPFKFTILYPVLEELNEKEEKKKRTDSIFTERNIIFRLMYLYPKYEGMSRPWEPAAYWTDVDPPTHTIKLISWAV